MTAGVRPPQQAEPAAAEVPPGRSRLTVALVCALAVALLAAAGAVGYLVGDSGSSGDGTVRASSVDAGFSRDMAAHHTQATIMAGYTRDHTSDPQIKLLAYDIESQQYGEIGTMQGWLDAWGLSRSSTIAQMSWMPGHMHMAADALMPGMATQAEMDRLESLTGKALDVYFLQLMIRHHQGGLPMAQYAAAHAETGYVRNLAQKMFQNQSNEIVQMEQLLRARGSSPLPAPEQ